MKHSIIILLIISCRILAQELTTLRIVGNPELLPTEIISNEKRDANGKVCAGLVILSDIHDLTFKSYNGIIDLNISPGKYFLYLSPDESVIEVYSNLYAPTKIIFSDLGIKLASGVVYQIKLTGEKKINAIPINILTEPSQAKIYIDDIPQELGKTTFNVTAGRHKIRIEKEGYKPIQTEINVSTDNTLFQYRLEEIKPVKITIKSNPPGATIFIDDIEVGETDKQIFQFPGKYRLKLIKYGYLPLEEIIEVREGTNPLLTYELSRNIGYLNVRINPADAQLYINGQRYEKSIIELLPGKYLVELRKQNYKTIFDTITIRGNETLNRNYQLEKNTGELNLLINPFDAQLFIDNINYGLIRDVEVLEGTHLIEVKKDGYEAYSEVVNVERNKTVTKTINLQEAYGSLLFTVSPVDAEVKLYKNDKLITSWEGSNYIEKLGIGSYRLVASAPKYKSYEKKIEITKGVRISEDIKLEMEDIFNITVKGIIVEGDAIKNTKLEKSATNYTIYYDVDIPDNQEFEVKLYLVDKQNSFVKELKFVNGDVGKQKGGIIHRKIIWNYLDEINKKLDNSNLYIKIVGYNITNWDLLFTYNNGDTVLSMSFNPAGNKLVSGGRDKKVKVWDLNEFKLLWIGTHNGIVNSVSFSSDGNKVVSGSADYTLKVWESMTGKLLWSGTHNSDVYSVSFSPDGSKVVSGGGDAMVKVWETSTGKLLWSDKMFLTGIHSGWVYSVSFSPDGNKIVCGGGVVSIDKTIEYILKVWEANTGKLLWTGNHSEFIFKVTFSPDGNRVASGGMDNKLKVWETKTGKLLWTGNHSNLILSVTFSPDGSKVVSGSTDNTLKIWEKNTGKLLWVGNHRDGVSSVSFNSDGDKIVSGGGDNTLKVWDSSTGKLLWTGDHNNVVNLVSFSPDGSKIASGSWDKTIKIWTNRKILTLITKNIEDTLIVGEKYEIRWISVGVDKVNLEFTINNGKTWDTIAHNIAASNRKYIWNVPSINTTKIKIRITDTNQPTFFDESDNTFTIKEQWYLLWGGNHNGAVNSISFSPDGSKIVSGSEDNTLKVWDSSTGQLLWTGNHNGFITSVSFSPDGNKVVSGSWDNTIKVWDASTGKLLWTVEKNSRNNTIKVWNALTGQLLLSRNHSGVVFSVSFSPDGSKVVSGSVDKTVKVWDSSTGKLLWTGNHSDVVYSVSFSPDGNKVVSGSWDKTIKVWDASTGKLLWTGNHGYIVNYVLYSPDGSKVVSESRDKKIKVWEASTGQLLWTGDHNWDFSSVSFSPDGSKVVSRSHDNTVKVWDLSTGKLLWTGNHSDVVWTVAFSPDGNKVVSGSRDGTIKVWNVSIGTLLWTGNHISGVSSVSFSPDGGTVASGSWDNTIKVWDTLTGKLLWTGNHNGVVRSVSFSPDGSKIASGSFDGTIKIWTNRKY